MKPFYIFFLLVLTGFISGCTDGDSGNNGTENIIFKTAAAGESGAFYDVGIDKDGAIYAAGSANGFSRVLVMKLKEDGSLVSSFGTNGIAKATNPLFPGKRLNAYALALSPTAHVSGDAKIYVGGDAFDGQKSIMTIWGFDVHGKAASTFKGGAVSDPFEIDRTVALELKIDTRNRILTAGNNFSLLQRESYLWRFLPDGSIDNTFNNGLIEIPRLVTNGRFTTEQDDGLLYIGSSVYEHSKSHQYLIRYRQEGTLDTTYGDGGIVEDNRTFVECAQQSRLVASVAKDAAGTVYTVGSTCENAQAHAVVLSYLHDGKPNPSFGTDGIVELGDTGSEGVDLSVRSDGTLVVAGNYENGHRSGGYLWKLGTNGALKASHFTEGNNDCFVRFTAIADDGKGNVVVAGSECGVPTVWKYAF